MADKKISALTAASTPLAGTEVLPIVQSGSTVKVAVSDLTAGRDVSMKNGTLTGLYSQSAYEASNWITSWNNTGASGHQMLFGYNNGTSNRIGLYIYGGPGVANQLDFTVANKFGVYGGGGVVVGSSGDPGNGNLGIGNGNLVIGTSGKGIDFSATSGSGTSELLADYEEGTWTPTILFDGASTGVTYSLQSGVYTKVGRQVTLEFDVRLSNKGSSTGTWQIGGFPFASGTIGTGNLTYQTGGAGINQLGQIRVTSGSSSGALNYAVAGSTNQYIDTDATNSSICIGQIVYFV